MTNLHVCRVEFKSFEQYKPNWNDLLQKLGLRARLLQGQECNQGREPGDKTTRVHSRFQLRWKE